MSEVIEENTVHMNTNATLEDLQKVCDILYIRHLWSRLQVLSLFESDDPKTGTKTWEVECMLAGLTPFKGSSAEPFMALFNALAARFPMEMAKPLVQQVFGAAVDEVQMEIDARRGPKLPVCHTLEEHVFVLSGSCFRCGKTADEVFVKKA